MESESNNPQIIKPSQPSNPELSEEPNLQPKDTDSFQAIVNPQTSQAVGSNPGPAQANADLPPAPSLGLSGSGTESNTPASSEAAPAPSVSQAVGPVATPTLGQPPASDLGNSVSPSSVSGPVTGSFNDQLGGKEKRKKFSFKNRGKKFWALVSGGVLALLIGGGAYAYFGVYMSSGFVWKQSLGDMGKGYDRLVSYLNQQSNAHYKGFALSGSFNAQQSSDSYSGSISAKSDGSNNSFSGQIDLGVGKLDLEERSIKAPGNSEPDIYFQVSGIKAIDKQMNLQLGPQIDGLDGKWIVIDHNLIIDLKNQLLKQQKASSTPSLNWADVYSFLKAASAVNKKYVFTTNSQTAVTKVVKTYGRETVDGHDTYHYKVGFVPAHVKAYVTDMCAALQTSDLGSYIKQVSGQAVGTSSYCKDLEKSAGQIKSSQTVDIWADVKTRMIYKVRYSDSKNPAENFVDIGLNYKGGNAYPFFINGEAKDSSGLTKVSVTVTLDTSNDSLAMDAKISNNGTNGGVMSGDMTFKPSNAPLNLQTPAHAESIVTVLDEFGLGGYLQQLQSMGSNSQVGSLKDLPPSNLAANHEPAGILAPILSTALSQVKN